MTSFASVMCGDDVCKLLTRHLSPTYLKERADNSAYHISQETVCCNDEIGFSLGELHPSHFVNIADSGLDVCMNTAERSEVLLAKQ